MDLVPKEYKKKIDSTKVSAGDLKVFKTGKLLMGPKMIILVFSLLIISLAAYGVLAFLEFKTDKDIEASKKAYDEIIDRQDENLLKKIVAQGKSARILSDLFKSRHYASNLFKALAEITLPQVQWNSFYLPKGENVITLSGKSANYNVLARQMTAFEKDENWNKADFSSILLDKTGTISFSAKIEFNPDLLINK